jgi:CO/xanthine dehydrogenase FAD-binding subunit
VFHFAYHEPDSLAGIISLLADHGENAAPLAGGTDLLVDVRHGKLHPTHVVSLWGASELRGMSEEDGGSMRVGALCTAAELGDRFAARAAWQCLSEASLLLGSRQIQNVATVGGNICKASPAADLVTALLCLDARVLLSGPQGGREVPLESFLVGPGRTSMKAAEVLTGIRLPAPPPGAATAFMKIMRRKAEDLSTAAVSAHVSIGGNGRTVQSCRIALGAVGPCPFRARSAETILIGRVLSPALLCTAAAAARSEARPVDDIRASADYRREMIEVLVRRALAAAAERAGKGAGQ